MNDLEKELKKVIAEHLGVEKSKVELGAYLIADLNADPLEIPDLLAAVEHEFNVTIPEEEHQRFEKVSDILHFLQDNVTE